MTSTVAGELERQLTGSVRRDEPLARYTTYRIGGPAALLIEPAGPDDVVRTMQVVREAGMPWFALGLGSNLLVADAGFPGVVLRIGKGLAGLRRSGQRWSVGAGTPTPLLARRSAEAGQGGVHRLVGVPGTVGGGVFMNAGAHGQEFRQVVRRVQLVTGDGVVEERDGPRIAWQYRSSGLEHVVVIGAEIELEPMDPKRLRSEVTAHLRWRKAGTPFNEPCCGSVFRNPTWPSSSREQVGVGGAGDRRIAGNRGEGRTAGQLIDAAGMKGFRIGGAEVSRKHANYIVNVGNAAAADVMRVIEAVRARVWQEFSVELELEVQLIGES